MVNAKGLLVTLHQTFITTGGCKAPISPHKKLLPVSKQGATRGSAIRLAISGEILLLAEGIETALACMISTDLPCWATISAAGMISVEVPRGVKEALIMADLDRSGTGAKAAKKLAKRLCKRGIKVKIVFPSMEIPENQKGIDHLDTYIAKGKTAITDAIRSASYENIDIMDDLNANFFHTIMGGKHVVASIASTPTGYQKYQFERLSEFSKRFIHVPKATLSNGDKIPVDKYWLGNKKKNYLDGGTGFYPNPDNCPPNKLNLYLGKSAEPMDGPVDLYLNHLLKIICDSDNVAYRYLIGWMAHLIQKPWEKPGVCIVLVGGQGTGKGMMVSPLEKIVGSHYNYISEGEHITGKFNSQIATSILVFADEALFAGSPKAANKLKSLITEPYQSIEHKGYDAVSVSNYSRLIMASNEDWVIDAGIDERRYLVLSVSEKHKQDQKYFSALAEWTENFGANYLHNYLLHYGIEGFNPRVAPRTNALIQQKIDSLRPAYRFWYHTLARGHIGIDTDYWHDQISTSEMQAAYTFFRKDEIGTRSRATELGKMLSKMKIEKVSRLNRSESSYHYCLPPLEDARNQFEKYLGGTIIDW